MPAKTVYGEDTVLVKPTTWAQNIVKKHNIESRWEDHPEVTKDIKIDWECMHSVTKSHYRLHERIAFMKTLWSTYMYEHRRMCYKFSPASENNCAFCGRKIETQHHVLCECQGEKVAVIKQLEKI